MKVLELFESDAPSKVIKAKRILKFGLKSNSLGVDLANLKCEYFRVGPVIYIGKPGALQNGVKYRFENSDKPGFNAQGNSKLWGPESGLTLDKKVSTLDEAYRMSKEFRAQAAFIIDPDLVGDAKPVEKKSEEPTSPEDGFFVLGYWGNAYSRSSDDREYFWSGPFQDRKNAAAYGKRKQEKGQPKTFRDWVKGTSSVIRGVDKFVTAAKKVKMNPNVKDLEWVD